MKEELKKANKTLSEIKLYNMAQAQQTKQLITLVKQLISEIKSQRRQDGDN